MKEYKTIEECRKLFDNGDNTQEVITAKWNRHWNNAKNSNSIEVLNNLLKNHIRLLQEHPEENNGKERENIIEYLENKILKLTT